VGVLGHVGERLGDHVVGGYLDLLGQSPVDSQIDRDRGTAGERVERRT
jgi:hypothetical protein